MLGYYWAIAVFQKKALDKEGFVNYMRNCIINVYSKMKIKQLHS